MLLVRLARLSKYPLTVPFVSRLLGVSRPMLRAALRELAEEGRIVAWKRAGKGPHSTLYFTTPEKARAFVPQLLARDIEEQTAIHCYK